MFGALASWIPADLLPDFETDNKDEWIKLSHWGFFLIKGYWSYRRKENDYTI